MHILLTDICTCPRCGPEFGLILLVEELSERRVRRGHLACANCRERYPVVAGQGDFTLGASTDFGPPIGADRALRLAALAGVTAARSRLLVAGPAAAHAAALAELMPEIELVTAEGAPGEAGGPGLSRIAVAESLPFYSGRLAGVVLSGGAAELLLEEGARVLAPGGRLVLEPVPADARARLATAGLATLAEEGATLVAARS